MDTILTLIGCTLALIGAITGGVFFAIRYFEARLSAEKQNLIALAKAYFEPQNPDEPSQFAGFVQIASDTLARSITTQLKASFMGIQSKANQAERAIVGDIALDSVAMANPIVGAILSSFPSLQKRLRKNPELFPLVEQFAGKLGGQPKPPANGNGHSGQSVKFNL